MTDSVVFSLFSSCFFVALFVAVISSSADAAHDIPEEITVPSAAVALDNLVQAHPRIIAKAEDFDRISKIVKTDKFAADWYIYLKSEADEVLSEPVSFYEIPDGKRLLSVSRRVLFRVATLSLVYNIEKDRKYVDRVWAELEDAGNFKDWNPPHFLDTAEMCLAFAIGYDWLYDQLNDQQRQFIETAIVEKALNVALSEGFGDGMAWFGRVTHNWNQVCNAGLLAGALAIADKQPEISSKIVHEAIRTLPLAASEYAPDGAWGEGPTYWSYGTTFNVVAIAALESALGSDYGFTKLEGFDKAALFPVYMTSPAAMSFNFCDSSPHSIKSSALLWFASRYNYPVAADYFRSMMRRSKSLSAGRLAALGLIWYDPAVKMPEGKLPEPLNIKFREVECAAMRENFTDDDGMFLAFKGGRPSVNHGNIDSGTFVFDALGERWAMDLGAENYNIPSYFDGSKGGRRWIYYRMRAEGHNTLVINPAGQNDDQNVNVNSKITGFDPDVNNPSGVVDLSDAYEGFGVSKVVRSFSLKTDGDQRYAEIIDEITPVDGKPADIWWFMHTEAQIQISADGKKAEMTQEGKKVNVYLSGPDSAKFSVMPAKALPVSPNPPQSKDNEGICKLTVHLENVAETTELKVRLVPNY